MDQHSLERQSSRPLNRAGTHQMPSPPSISGQATSTVPWLYQVLPDGTPFASWPVGQDPLVVGRGECASARVDDEALSRSHFMIVRERGAFFMVDLDSQNGTRVDGQQVAGRKLNHGDLVEAGTSTFYFAAQELAPGEKAFVLSLAAMCQGLRTRLNPELRPAVGDRGDRNRLL